MTSIARTMLDLAGIVHRGRLERAVERAVRLRLLDERAVRATIERTRAERTFLKLIDDNSLPKPLTNTLVEGFLVDFYWPEHDLIVEIDCYATHGSEKAFHSHRERDAALSDAGYQLLRITDVQLHTEPALSVKRVERRLSIRTG